MKKVIVGLFILVFAFIVTEEKYIVIPEESIRFRVIPSSNNIEDIKVKEKVTEEIIKLMSFDSISINESRKKIVDTIPIIKSSIDSLFKEMNYKESYTINYGENFFPKKLYKDVLYKEGEYESLVITIGEGNGSNFWCVLFPPLCSLENKSESQDVEYKFKVSEILSKVMNNI